MLSLDLTCIVFEFLDYDTRYSCSQINKIYYTELSKSRFANRKLTDIIESSAWYEFCRQMKYTLPKYKLYNLCGKTAHEHKYSLQMCNRCILCFEQHPEQQMCILDNQEIKSYWDNVYVWNTCSKCGYSVRTS